jgi:broad specificity phosphatase PhoE
MATHCMKNPQITKFFAEQAVINHKINSLRAPSLTNMLTDFFGKSTPGLKKITFVRHAESVGNTKAIFYGRTDYPLTPYGETQATWIQKPLADTYSKIDKIYSSNLMRAYQTAQISLGLTDAKAQELIQVDPRVQELNFGELEFVNFSHMSVFESEMVFQSVLNGNFLSENIEKPAAVEKRLWDFFSELEDNKNILVYSHSGMGQVIMKKMGIVELYMNNCGV